MQILIETMQKLMLISYNDIQFIQVWESLVLHSFDFPFFSTILLVYPIKCGNWLKP